jgi:predicted dehydrogenase
MVSKLRCALCGCGHIAPRWLEVFQELPDIELCGIADPDPHAFEKLAKYKLDHIPQYSIIEQLYQELHPDAVVIATPPQYHSRYIIGAIDAGIHVLTEKPLCTDVDQFNHIRAALKKAQKKKLITAVNQQYRWNPRIQAIHDAVQSHQLGDVFLVQSVFNQNNYHFEEWWRQQLEFISLFNWYVHIVDSMRYYLEQKPVAVWAKFIHPPHSKILGESSMILNVTFEKGTEWILTANQESVAGPTTSGHTTFTMYGTKGTLINTKNEPPYLFDEKNEKIELGENIGDIDNEFKYPPGWKDTVIKFIDAIKTGKPHPTSIEDNLWTMAIMLSAMESFKQKRSVEIHDFLNL